MSEISLSQFRTTLDQDIERQGQRNYEWDEGGVLVPTPNNVPPPSAPTRRPARPLPTGPSPFGIGSAIIDDSCNVRRLIGADAFRRSTLPTAALDAASPSWRNTFDSAWDRLCGDSPGAHPGAPNPIVPFQGGQCNGARYNVQVNLEVYQVAPGCTASPRQTATVGVWGPITGVDIGQNQAGTPNLVRVFCRGLSSQPIQPAATLITLGSFASTAGCPPARITSVSIVPQAGQPNNCGNPPPRYPATAPAPIPQRTINLDVGGTNIQIQPSISFNVDEGAIQIDAGPDINFTFDGVNLNFNDGNGGTPGNTPARPSPDDTATDPNEPAPPPPTNLDPNTEEPEEPEEVIRAVLVTVSQVNGFSTLIAGQGADLDNYFPDLGTVKFRIRAGENTSGFTNPIRVQNIRAFIECPWDGGAFEVVGTPRPGVIWELTPIFDVSTIPA